MFHEHDKTAYMYTAPHESKEIPDYRYSNMVLDGHLPDMEKPIALSYSRSDDKENLKDLS